MIETTLEEEKMTPTIALALKKAGFPQHHKFGWVYAEIEGEYEPHCLWTQVKFPEIETYAPTLTEVIHELGEDFEGLIRRTFEFVGPKWMAYGPGAPASVVRVYADSPDAAVALLYIATAEKKR